MGKLLKTKEVAAKVGVSVGVIKGWQRRGILNGYRQGEGKGGSPWLFREEDIVNLASYNYVDKAEYTSWLCSVHKVPLRRIPQFPSWLVHDGCHEQFTVIDGHLCILENCYKYRDIETGEYREETKGEKLDGK